MKEFPMCPSCADEYHNPDTRRYDAQPVCCNDCGPEVYLAGREERGREAITYTRKIIASGGIVAIKGIGGFTFAVMLPVRRLYSGCGSGNGVR